LAQYTTKSRVGFEHPPSFEKDILNTGAGVRDVMKLIEDDHVEILEAYSRLLGLSRIYEGKWEDRETRAQVT
jgi:hypothetical protein